MRIHKTLALGILAAAAAAALAGGALALSQTRQPAAVTRGESAPPAQAQQPSGEGLPKTLTLGGRSYALRDDITTVLFMGVDVNSDYDPAPGLLTVGTGGRSDVLLLAILYEEDETSSLLQISRDSIVSVDVYSSKTDTFLYSADMQITMQYAMGGSDRRSVRLVKNKVGEMLGGLAIDYGISLKMDGMAPLAEVLGGIPVTMTADYTAIDPAFTEGASLRLTGEQAYRFARWRDTTHSGGNDDRMARQRRLLSGVLDCLSQGGDELYTAAIEAAEPYMYSDADAETLEALSRYRFTTSYMVPGETVYSEDDQHDEYIVDYPALEALIAKLFYTEV